jgi:hypothetical protein
MYQLQGLGGEEQRIQLTLYTDSYVVRGTMRTRQRRLSDILNDAEHEFLVLTDAVMDEYGSRAIALRAEYVQVNLAAVLFAVADAVVEPVPELRTPKVAEQALISIPPFRIIGHIHLLPERNRVQPRSGADPRAAPRSGPVGRPRSGRRRGRGR